MLIKEPKVHREVFVTILKPHEKLITVKARVILCTCARFFNINMLCEHV